MKRQKPLICFDLDGTIIESKEAHVAAFNQAFKANNLKPVDTKKLISALGPGVIKIIKKFYPHISSVKLKSCVKDHSNFLLENTSKMHALPGVIKALEQLKQKYTLALLSNNLREDIYELLEGAKIKVKTFDLVIGSDDVPHQKPAPDEIFKAEKLVHKKAEYMVGDTIYDIRAGKRAGIKTIAVLSGVHSFAQLWREKPTIIIKSVAILPEALLK